MKKLILISSALLAAALSFSCNKESEKLTYANQETRIETYINNQLNADETGTMYVVSNGGSERLVMKEGEGAPLTGSGSVTFRYAGYVLSSTTISSSNLFATNIAEIAKTSGWIDEDSEVEYDAITEDMSKGLLIKGLHNGLTGVKAGEECMILFSGKYGYGGNGLGTIPAKAALAYYIQVLEVTE